jgi:hypothetical protein
LKKLKRLLKHQQKKRRKKKSLSKIKKLPIGGFFILELFSIQSIK